MATPQRSPLRLLRASPRPDTDRQGLNWRATSTFSLIAMLIAIALSLSGCLEIPEEDETDPQIWAPTPGASWQIQLSGTIDTSFNVDMYDLDLFNVPEETIQLLKTQGRIVICHFSAGTVEDWRSDAGDFPSGIVGLNNERPREHWLDIRQTDLLGPIMQARMDLAVAKGCDGIDAANIDGYAHDTGFDLSYDDQLAYNRWLADQAHSRGLSIGLNNNVEQIVDLVAEFDWARNEECFRHNQCELLKPFTEAGKAVFGIEYVMEASAFCAEANQLGFSFLRKERDLGAWRESCQTFVANEPPEAHFTFTSADNGHVDFNADTSSDDGMIVEYTWDFGDGSPAATGVTVSHTYSSTGSYLATLTVTDDADLTATTSAEINVTVVNQAPVASFTTSATDGTVPLTVAVDASSSSDDGTIVSYHWTFGDTGTADGAAAMHTYNTPGDYLITLTVIDNADAQGSAEQTVTVHADTPTPDIWNPAPGTSWQWQLTGEIDTSFDVRMYDIDLFDTPQATIDALHAQGRIVICYFSAGSFEEWRPDAGDFPASVLGQTLAGWPDEKWLDIREIDTLAPIMSARLDLAVEKNCDGVEPDNVDGYTNNSGFALNYDDQLAYNLWLAEQAHARHLSIGLKNDLNQVADLEPHFDWALNEQCFQYNECELLLPFIEAGKAVFGVEYSGDPDNFCPQANAMNLDWLHKRLDLDAYRVACR